MSNTQLYEHCDLRLSERYYSNSEALESRKIDRKQLHYITFSMKLIKNCILVLCIGMIIFIYTNYLQVIIFVQLYTCAGMILKNELLLFYINNDMQGI
ncbi:MAG: hypothetical protein ACR5KW_00620 [Wolbachia sp.]